MPQNLRSLIDRARLYLREETVPDVSGNQWTDAQIAAHVNEAIDQIVADVLEADEDFFIATQDYDFVANQAAYDLPPGVMRIRKLEYIAGGTRIPILEQRGEEDDEGGMGISVEPSTGTDFTYAVVGDQIHLEGTPGGAVASAMRLWYVRKPPDLTYGKATAGAAATITFQASTSTTGLAPDPLDDAYNGCWLMLISGTGAGQRRRIADYVGSTRVATVSPVWTTPPDATTVYALESMIPEPAGKLPAILAAVFALNDIDEDASRLEARADAMHDRLIQAVEQRTNAERVTQPWDPDDGDWSLAFG